MFRRLRIWLLVLAAVAIVCLIAALVSARRNVAKPAATDIGALADVLKRAAEEKLAPPAIANEQIVINETPDKAEIRAKEVIDAAIQSGGTAVKTTNPDGSISMLAQIPNTNTELFRGLVSKGQITKETAVREGKARLIEVLIKTAPPITQSESSPTPP